LPTAPAFAHKLHSLRPSLVSECERYKGERGDAVVLAREMFLASGPAGLKNRKTDARDEKIHPLQKALAETALNLQIFRQINRVYERKHGPLGAGKSTK
jgi:hypothetical protein